MNKKAFTLIELLVVIAIIGILSGVIVVSMNGAVGAARDGMRKADISVLRTALLEYSILNNNTYPIADCSVNESCTTLYEALVPTYIGTLPTDPLGTYYTYESDGSSFITTATLSDETTYSYDSTTGFSIGSGSSYVSTCAAATGGGVTCAESLINGDTEVVYSFTGAGSTTLTIPAGVTSVDYLVVGGGGGGGKYIGGGGGAGAFWEGTLTGLSGPQTVTVGAGGAGATVASTNGNSGGVSEFSSGATLVHAHGGGGGGYYENIVEHKGVTGGSAGGNGGGGTQTAQISDQVGHGNSGGTGVTSADHIGAGGGGGAGGIGGNGSAAIGGAGGTATHSSITGTDTVYAGGGGGSGHINEGTASGGAGGAYGGVTVGGLGGLSGDGTQQRVPTSGVAHTGSGGGGGSHIVGTNAGGAGGSGIVIIRFTKP